MARADRADERAWRLIQAVFRGTDWGLIWGLQAAKSNVVAQKRLAFVLDWSGTAFTPVPEALGPAPQRMWLRGALR
jgi:hypothetical protein